MTVINLRAFSETATKSVATAELRIQVKNSLVALEQAWMEELENPSESRSRNPFDALVLNYEPSDDKNDANMSDTSESDSSKEDNDDLNDSDFAG